MRILSLSEAKMKLSKLIDTVNTTDEEIIITKNGRPAAVLVSTDEFDHFRHFKLFEQEDRDAIFIQPKERIKQLRTKIGGHGAAWDGSVKPAIGYTCRL